MYKDPKSYTILVLEDNPGDQLLVVDYLEDEIASPVIHTAELFKEGAGKLRNHFDELDVILLDLSLPDKKGEELLLEMLELADDIPIIILTGYTNVEFAVKSISLGASDYLLKDTLNAPVLYKSIVYNIERNRYLLQIKESEQRYAELFHLSPLPMWLYDMGTFRFLDVNEAAIKHYGYSYEEFMGMTILDIRPEQEVPKIEKSVAQLREKDVHYSEGEYTHCTKEGKEIIVDLRSNIIEYKGKKAEIVLASDITERYKHIQAIEEQNKKLREIAWKQSHVVRAPLARIMGLIELIEMDAVSPEENKELLKNIMDSAHELDDVIREIVELSNHYEVDKD